MGNTQVFDGPGDQYAVIALLEDNQAARIVGVSQNRKWWAVDLPYYATGRGWVSVDKAKAENVTNVQVIVQETAMPGNLTTPGSGASIMAIANVNVRSGPDIKYLKIGNIKKGQSAEVIGVSDDNFWWLIKLPGTKNVQGWISRDYVVASKTDNVPVIGSQAGAEQTIVPGSPYYSGNYDRECARRSRYHLCNRWATQPGTTGRNHWCDSRWSMVGDKISGCRRGARMGSSCLCESRKFR